MYLYMYICIIIYTYSVLGPAIQAQSPPSSSVKPKAEIPDTWLALVISHVSQLQSPKM